MKTQIQICSDGFIVALASFCLKPEIGHLDPPRDQQEFPIRRIIKEQRRVPVFDTTRIHANAVVEIALATDSQRRCSMVDLTRSRPVAVVAIALSGVLLGAILGAFTNSINGWVSPLYFRNIMRWEDVQDIWRASIAQGILEGIMFGLAFAVIFTAVVGIVSKARSPFGLAAIHLLLIGVAALVCWALGGVIAMGLATLSPEFYQHAFRGVPEEFDQMLRYAWVGGSIWGMQFGGFASVVVGSVLFRAKWRQRRVASTHSQTVPSSG